MYLSSVEAFRNQIRVKNIEVQWWNPNKLQSEFPFEEVVFGGELDYHLVVSRAQLREILDNNTPEPFDELTDGVRTLMKLRAKTTNEIEQVKADFDDYDEVKIVLFYWQSMGGPF